MSDIQLPELPRHQYCLNSQPVLEGYAAHQMQEFARAAVIADRERRAQPLAQDEAVSVDDLLSLLPGPYYMDPPDGGSVTVLEQLRRMALDAARWRAFRAAELPNGLGVYGDELDAACDELIGDEALAQRGEAGK